MGCCCLKSNINSKNEELVFENSASQKAGGIRQETKERTRQVR